jgi:hypothetical protein
LFSVAQLLLVLSLSLKCSNSSLLGVSRISRFKQRSIKERPEIAI